MAAFDYIVALDNAETYLDTASHEYVSEVVVNPSSEQIFYSYVNPGHAGTTFAIEYSLTVLMLKTAGSAGDLACVWQIKASGGSWVTLTSGSVSDPGVGSSDSYRDTGVYTTAVLMPCEIQLLITDADASWKVASLLGSGVAAPYCNMRFIGTVT